jgi:hypothetical protein
MAAVLFWDTHGIGLTLAYTANNVPTGIDGVDA